MRVAMISYNLFVDGERNGWKNLKDNSILLLQNTAREGWGMSRAPLTKSGEDKQHTESVAILDPLWTQLQNELPTIDAVVMYVGGVGAERVIAFAAKHGLTPDRAIFVCCDCNLHTKLCLINSNGFSSSIIIDCECEGHSTMNRIYRRILNEGRLLG